MSSGGSFNPHRGGAYSRGGGGRHNQGRGRATNGGRFSEPRRERAELGSDNEPFMLPAKPSNKESQKWLSNQGTWARTNVPKHDWHIILNPEGGEEPDLEIEPLEPSYDDFEDRIPEYNAKCADYRDRRKEVVKRNEEKATDGKKLYGQLTKFLSAEFVLNIKSKFGAEFFADENSKKLVDAINSEFLGMNSSGASGHFEVAEQAKVYHNLKQYDDMSLSEYHQRKSLAYRTLCQGKFHLQEYDADAKTYEEIFNTFIEQDQQVNDFVMGLNWKVYESYLTDLKLQRGGEEWPQTVTEAYERASQLEDHFVQKHRKNEARERSIPVMYAGAKDAKGGAKGGAKGFKGQPGKSAQKTDSKGKKICHHEERNGAGSCPRKESCWFSHDIDHVGNNKGTIATGKPKERDPHCGGGPGPSGKG